MRENRSETDGNACAEAEHSNLVELLLQMTQPNDSPSRGQKEIPDIVFFTPIPTVKSFPRELTERLEWALAEAISKVTDNPTDIDSFLTLVAFPKCILPLSLKRKRATVSNLLPKTQGNCHYTGTLTTFANGRMAIP